jgi:hypothetical protein
MLSLAQLGSAVEGECAMSRKQTAVVVAVLESTALPTEPTEPTEDSTESHDPILGPKLTVEDFKKCTDISGLKCAPVICGEVLNDVLAQNGTAMHFRGVLNGRAYFDDQKYATRLRHANERASEGRVDGTVPKIGAPRKARHVDITGAKLAEMFGSLAHCATFYAETTLRVPRELAELDNLTGVDFDGYADDFKASAVTDAQDALRSFGRSVNREAGERTAPTDGTIATTLGSALRNAHDMCSCDACECTVVEVATIRSELATAWEAYRAASSVKKATLVDLSF